LTKEEYERFTASAWHLHPVRARRRIREGARRALRRAQEEDFGIIPLEPPFERVAKFRASQDNPQRTISRETHPTSVIGVMNLPFHPQAWEG